MSSSSKSQEQLTPFGYALAGALGGVFSNAYVILYLYMFRRSSGLSGRISVVYPLDTYV